MGDKTAPAEMVVREKDGKTTVNNQEVSKEMLNALNQQFDTTAGIKRDATGKRIKPTMEERKRAAMSDTDSKPFDINEKFKRGGKVKSKSASSRADGIAQRGKTRGRIV